MVDQNLAAVDMVALGGYFVAVMAVGLWATFRAKRGNTKGFFLAGRSMTWLPIAGSMYATNMGAPMFVGLAGSAASVGFAPIMFEWHATYILILLGWVFVPIYFSSGCTTLSEYLGKRFGGQRLRVYYACIQLLLSILIGISAELFAGSLFINQVLGWNVYLSTVLILAVTSIYTIGGGLAAVIYTDTVQAVMLIVGSGILCVLSLIEVGGYEAMVNQFLTSASNHSYRMQSLNANLSCGFTPSDSTTLFRDLDSDYPWPGLIFGLTMIATYYWCTQQVMVQRNLSAKSIVHSKAACVLASYLKALPFFFFIIPGMISRILYPDEVACSDPEMCSEICENSSGCTDIAYPLLVIRLMPSGLKGLMLAAMLAALMSSLTSYYNSSSSVFSLDIWNYFRPHARDQELVIVGRAFGVVMVLISIAWLPIIQALQGTRLFDYVQSTLSYIAPPFTVVFLMGVFWRRTTEPGAFWGLVTGLAVGLSRMLLDFSQSEPDCGSGLDDTRPKVLTEVHYLHFAMILAFIVAMVTTIISIMTKPRPQNKLHRVTWWTRNDPFPPPECDPIKRRKGDKENTITEQVSDQPTTSCSKLYNTLCGFGDQKSNDDITTDSNLSLDKSDKVIQMDQSELLSYNEESSWINRVCDVNAVIAIAVTCAIIGFYA